jgi:hypothetical protein
MTRIHFVAVAATLLISASGCKRSLDKGFAVAVTVEAAQLPVELRDRIVALAFVVEGAETWDNLASPYAISDQLRTGGARWIYRPRSSTTGRLDFHARALDASSTVVAVADDHVDLVPGATSTLTLQLTPEEARDGGATDMTPVVKQNGEPCQPGVDVCASGNCVDRVCCESKCDSPCSTCALPGMAGQCLPVPAGSSPTHGTCPLKSPNDPVQPCSYDGKCDGAGNCRLWPYGTQASPSTCAANQYTPPDVCDGMGGKLRPASTPCDPFICNATGTACYGPPCADNSVCASGKMCDPTTKSCGQLPNGRACTAANQCTSGFCVDGVCCESACNGKCEACDADPLKPGQCLPVTGAVHTANGYRTACTGNGLNGCGGQCNGTNRTACVYPPATQVCADAACANNMSTPRVNCDGAGSCNVPAATACPPANNATGVCRGSVCGIQCISGDYADCDNNPGNGCETNLKTDDQRCGSCSNNCLARGQQCMNGSCACPSGKKPCGNTCIDNAACCTPADCGCTATTGGTDPDCVARGGGLDYGFRCGANVCLPVVVFNDPRYAECQAVCGINKMCCPTR